MIIQLNFLFFFYTCSVGVGVLVSACVFLGEGAEFHGRKRYREVIAKRVRTMFFSLDTWVYFMKHYLRKSIRSYHARLYLRIAGTFAFTHEDVSVTGSCKPTKFIELVCRKKKFGKIRPSQQDWYSSSSAHFFQENNK